MHKIPTFTVAVLSAFLIATSVSAQGPANAPISASKIEQSMLSTIKQQGITASIYLVNGIKLQGQIEHFDDKVILLRAGVSQLVYLHAVSMVVPHTDITFDLSK